MVNNDFLIVARKLKDLLNLFFKSYDKKTGEHLFDYREIVDLLLKLYYIINGSEEEDMK